MRCEHCGILKSATITMASPAGVPWYLCWRCWDDGLPKKAEPEREPEPARRSVAKDDVGDFDRPAKPKRVQTSR